MNFNIFVYLRRKYNASSLKYVKNYKCVLIFFLKIQFKKEATYASFYYRCKVCTFL